MHFIFIQLLLALTASAVPLIDIGQLYDQKLPIPDNDILNSNGGVDIGELNEYRKSDPINYPTRSKRGVEDFSDVNELESEEKGLDIDKLPQYNSINSTNYPPRSKRSDEQNSQTITDDGDILPQSELFIDELLKHYSINNTNYPRISKRSEKQLSDVSEHESKDGSNDSDQLDDQNLQTTTDDVSNLNDDEDGFKIYMHSQTYYLPRPKRSNEQLSDVSELESKDGAKDVDQLDDQNLQTTTDDVSNLYNDGLDIEIFDQDNSSDTTNYPPRSKRSNEQLSNVSKLESKDGSNHSDQLDDQNSQTTSDDVSNLHDDGVEFYAFFLFSNTDTTDYPSRSKRSNEQLSDVDGLGINNSGINNDAAAFSIQPLTKDDIPVIEIGSLYNHEGKIPRNELPGSPNNPGPVDLEDLHQYKGNYPVYPRH